MGYDELVPLIIDELNQWPPKCLDRKQSAGGKSGFLVGYMDVGADMRVGRRLAPSVFSLGTGRRLSLLVLGHRKQQQSQQHGPALGFGGPKPGSQRHGKIGPRNKSGGKAVIITKPPVYDLVSCVICPCP